jgi:KipI family sensor histidine kinase inhibitor
LGGKTGWVPFGDAALLAPRPAGAQAQPLLSALRRCVGVVDVVVSEQQVCVHFDPRSPPSGLEEAMAQGALETAWYEPREIVVPARYDGPDLADVAARAGLSVDEVVTIHAAGSYEVLMLGFVPGFAYLGGLDSRLVVPRRPVPRTRVAAGAVALAAGYTAIYPFASPGGWSLIGSSTGGALFSAETGARLRLGDRVRFERVG